MNSLHPSIKTVWSIRYLIRTLSFSFFFLIAEILLIRNYFIYWFLPIGYATGILFITGIIISIVYTQLKYRCWKFEVRDEELLLVRGVITKITTIAPFTRVQHLDVEQHILERMFGIGTLVVYTAGTRGADIIIPGLPIEYAEDLRDKLKTYAMEAAL